MNARHLQGYRANSCLILYWSAVFYSGVNIHWEITFPQAISKMIQAHRQTEDGNPSFVYPR